jgi:MFS superfamily sulfate permease-like transporter
MSSSRFMPLAPGAPARWLAGSVALPAVAIPGVARRLFARPDARTDRRARATVNARTSLVPCLGMSVSLAAGQTDRLADIILDRVLSCPYPVGTVILDLHAASDIDADSRSALLSLHRRLRSLGTQLRIATASHQLASRLREAGLPQQLSADTIHDSFRSAVLATYAALPGPGLVTARVRAALDTPVEPVDA